MKGKKLHPFESELSAWSENVEFELKSFDYISWSDFLLNPRRLRGSDFLMRWSQGVWSEHRIIEAVNSTKDYFAIPYGPSGAAPHDDVRQFELYFERLEKAGLGKIKRPDLLVFKKNDKIKINKIIEKLGGIAELPFVLEGNSDLRELIKAAVLAIECENSLWVSKKMPDYNSKLSPQKRLGGKKGLKKVAVLPTVIIKEEDRIPLKKWQEVNKIPIHVWHVFYDQAFGLSLNKAEFLINGGFIEPTVQTFQAPGGATTKKIIYKFYYLYAYPVGESVEQPNLIPAHIEDKNGHILPYVKFEGGSLKLNKEVLNILQNPAYHDEDSKVSSKASN